MPSKGILLCLIILIVMFTCDMQIENIASISEQNAAATDEVLATVENENSEIIQVSSVVKDIYKLSSDLRELVKNEQSMV